ncbi:MAG: type II toxin-antitoxin system VapC family toxin [Planctomycetaceae bacterium]
MRPSVYIETSIIGHLASRPSALLVTAANQQVTREFWDDHRSCFELFISQAVLDECAAGDPDAALERADLMNGLPVLDINENVTSLATALMTRVPLPSKANVDAVHIAVSAAHGVDYLVTWNCKHIANPALRGRIESTCRSSGFEPPVICTPPELIEVNT